MDWDNLKVALAVVQAGSLTGAAQRLGMDQTTAGRRLSALETQLGSKLFIRSKSGFLPTDQGQIVLADAERIEARLERMGDMLSNSQHGPSGIVRVMANTWMLQLLADQVFPNLLESSLGLELRLSGRLPPTPLHGEATVSLWFDAAATGSDIAVPFCRVPYASYQSANFDCTSNNWVQFKDDDAHGPSFSRQVRKRLAKNAQVRLTATDATILLAATRSGFGRCVLPMCLAKRDEGLIRATGEMDRIERVLHIHINPATADTKRVRTVIKGLRSGIEELLDAELFAAKHPLIDV
ncbi:MAG: LysR family transcriptional regulator [Boseongicola sp.]|nr:MAG: LysR family transcriptional regulator [Boseongicola sp.]